MESIRFKTSLMPYYRSICARLCHIIIDGWIEQEAYLSSSIPSPDHLIYPFAVCMYTVARYHRFRCCKTCSFAFRDIYICCVTILIQFTLSTYTIYKQIVSSGYVHFHAEILCPFPNINGLYLVTCVSGSTFLFCTIWQVSWILKVSTHVMKSIC